MKKGFTIQKLINDAVKNDDRKDYVQKSWWASSLGGCLTGAYLTRKGLAKKSFNDRTLRVFQAGRMFEDWLVGLVAKQTNKFETQVGCSWKEMNLTGYADLVINDLVYEVKSKHSRAFWYMDRKGEGASRHNQYQLWTYLKCLGKKEGRLIYISKDDLGVLEYPVFVDDKKLESEVVAELTTLNRAWKEELPPKPIEDKKDWRYKYCDIHKEHCLKQPKYLDEN